MHKRTFSFVLLYVKPLVVVTCNLVNFACHFVCCTIVKTKKLQRRKKIFRFVNSSTTVNVYTINHHASPSCSHVSVIFVCHFFWTFYVNFWGKTFVKQEKGSYLHKHLHMTRHAKRSFYFKKMYYAHLCVILISNIREKGGKIMQEIHQQLWSSEEWVLDKRVTCYMLVKWNIFKTW